MNAVLFLDIDGVLNPYKASTPHGDWHKIKIGDVRVWASKDLGDWLNHLIENGVHIVWATTWVNYPEHLKAYVEYIGLDIELDCIEYDYLEEDGELSECGKLSGVKAWIEQNKPQGPIMWIDDELGSADIAWAMDNNIHCHSPHSGAGLRSKEVRAAIEAILIG